MFLRLYLIVFILHIYTFGKAQSPDLSKIPDLQGKIKTWLVYCAELRLNKKGTPNNYVLLQEAGLKGLQMTKPDDDSDKASFNSYVALGYYYQIKFDSAQYYFYKSLSSAQNAHATKLIASACEALMSINFQLEQLDKVDSCKIILQAIMDTSKDNSVLQDIYAAFGSYYQQKSFYSTAQDYYIKSIQLREKIVDTTQNSKAKFDFAIQCDQLSKLYLNTEMVDKSLSALRKAERFADISPVVGNRLLSSFVEAFTMSGNIDSALYYNKKLIVQTKNQSSFPSELISSNLNIATYYIDHKRYEKAFPYLNSGDSLAIFTKSPFLIFQAQMIKGKYFEETGKFEESISLLEKAQPVAVQLDKGLYANILNYIALDYKGMGNTKAALQYYEKFVGMQDTLNKEKLSRTFADLETRYQTNEKQNQIVALDQKNKLSILELKQASNTRRLLIIGLASLGVFSLLLFFIYRNKEKLNKILNQRNQQLDELNNELSVANDTKAKLFGIIGHDLRSPVSSIVQLLHLQKEKQELLDPISIRDHEEKLKTASENVLETMEDLLLWSKSQMQHFIPQFRQVDIAELVKKELIFLKQRILEKNILVRDTIVTGFIQNTDENFASVIIRNLLQNAVKNNEAGKIISITNDVSCLYITNAATNTTAEAINALIQNKDITSKYSGFGLQIAKELADLIGAKIFFEQNESDHLTAVLCWENNQQSK
jgi:signal transduction histidine kinase